jgi:hypothetical protein
MQLQEADLGISKNAAVCRCWTYRYCKADCPERRNHLQYSNVAVCIIEKEP